MLGHKTSLNKFKGIEVLQSIISNHIELKSFFNKASQVALVVKNTSANAAGVRNVGSLPGLGRSHGGGHGNPLWYSCLENPMDRGAWQATVPRVTKSWTQLRWLRVHACSSSITEEHLRNSQICALNNTFLNNQWIKVEYTRSIKNILRLLKIKPQYTSTNEIQLKQYSEWSLQL